MNQFNLVVCGGTFDHFHKGHEKFLRFILSLSDKVVLGLTTNKYIQNKKLNYSIESYQKRKDSVKNFLKGEDAFARVGIEPIDDLFIPKKWEKLNINAIAVSNDTQRGAKTINEDREKRGLSKLKIIVVPMFFVDSNEEISSFRIRQGEINRAGRLYLNPLWLKTDLRLPDNLRQELKTPFGEIVDVVNLPTDKNSLVITVGDVTSKFFNEKSLGQNISVIDFKVNREEKFINVRELGFSGFENIFHVDNPAGCISSSLLRQLSVIFKLETKDKIVLQINGEEDLVVLPLVLFAPLNTVIYYGQPPLRQGFAGQAGLVKVVVSESVKDKAYNLISKFRPI